jgi:hypothetical protein
MYFSCQAINKIAEAVQVLGLDHLPHSSYSESSDNFLLPAQTAADRSSAQSIEQQQHHHQQPPLADATQLHADGGSQQQLLLQQDHPAVSPLQQQPQQLLSPAPVPHELANIKRWAIDIGACPGGWTTYLAECCGFSVVAVDPAELHPEVTAHPAVAHVKARVQDAAEQIQQLLAGQQVSPSGLRATLLHCLSGLSVGVGE